MIRVVARSEDYANRFLLRHETLVKRVSFEFNQSSFFSLINNLINECKESFVCVVHDDVTLGREFDLSVDELVAELNRKWPNWGLVGNAGVSSFLFGFSRNTVVRYLADPHGGPNLLGHIMPAQSIDGNVMLLNLEAMRRLGVRLPSFEGFQLYDIILSYEVLKAGLAVLVAPHLACWHDSGGDQTAFDSAAGSPAFHNYLSDTLLNRRVKTLNGDINIKPSEKWAASDRIDVEVCSLKNASVGRPISTAGICIRTQFRRPQLLQRALETAKAFVAAAENGARFSIYVLTDQPLAPSGILDGVRVVYADLSRFGDSRNRLIQVAAREIDADWLWFVDDDDWLFPNEALRLGLVLNTVPPGAVVMLDSQAFNECISDTTSAIGAGYKMDPGRYFYSNHFTKSMGGHNHIPMCGMVLYRNFVQGLSKKNFENIVYFEDFSLLLQAIIAPGAIPVFIESLFSGISVRETGNSITETDRTKWNKSMSEMVSIIARDISSSFLTVSHMTEYSKKIVEVSRSADACFGTRQGPEADILLPPNFSRDPLKLLSATDRNVVLAFRALRASVRALFLPSQWAARCHFALTVLRKTGVRGLLRQMATAGSRL